MRAKKSILLIDDHPIMRQGLRSLINNQKDLIVCGECEDGRRALDVITSLKPDLVVADITMPGKGGLELIKDIHAMYPELPVIVLSMHDESFYATRVLRAGARGYVMKQEGSDRLLEAIRRVLNGQIHVSEKMAASILEIFSGRRAGTHRNPMERLTDREFEAFQLIGQGRGTRQIAQQLHLSVKTVEVHRANIKRKLNLKNSPELIRYAVRWAEPQNQEILT